MGALAELACRPNIGTGAMNRRKTFVLAGSILFSMQTNSLFSQVDGRTQHSLPRELHQNSAPYRHLSATLDSVRRSEKSSLSILHIGGSHVQAGWIAHFLREQLALLAPEAQWSRGLMLPYRLAHTNTPTHFRTEMTGSWSGESCAKRNWTSRLIDPGSGTGMQVHTSSELASIQHVAFLPDSTKITSDSFDIWTNANRNEISFGSAQSSIQLTAFEGGNGWRLTLPSPVDTFRLDFFPDENRSTPLVYEGVYAELNGSTQIVINEWGHNGLHIQDIRDCPEFAVLAKRLKPDLVILGVGLNDAMNEKGFELAQFALDYSWTINALKEALPETAILLLSNTPVNSDKPFITKNSEQIRSFLQSYSKSVGCGFFDLSEAMGGTESMQEWMAQGWMKSDGIHFHSAGYQHIAYQIFTEIERAFLTDKKARNSTER